jgi:4-hydroxybenzoate polyprenyltransferase
MRAYLQLLRLPTVFTAMADIFLGYLLTHRGFELPEVFLALLAASCGLYLAGMVFNDVFDREQDARERPNRPIPSGRVSLRAAVILACVLMLAGVAAAMRVSMWSAIIAVLLAIAVLGYNAVLKRTPLGPLGMGTCRFLNVMLGASGLPDATAAGLWAPPQLVCAIGLGIYIVGVTWFARTEARKSSQRQLTLALVVLDAGVAFLAWVIVTFPGRAETHIAIILLLLVTGSLNFRAFAAVGDPTPERVQPMIKLMLLDYVMLDATLVYWHTADGMQALPVACLVVPAMLLGRFIAMT